jgi:hypothetical protein
MIRRLTAGWRPSPDSLSTFKKQIKQIESQLSDIKGTENPLDKYMKKAVG